MRLALFHQGRVKDNLYAEDVKEILTTMGAFESDVDTLSVDQQVWVVLEIERKVNFSDVHDVKLQADVDSRFEKN